tara:strand:+ start:8059 stop:9369 length:1311 start_codon:yes stop_codon:yes gene_type:complete
MANITSFKINKKDLMATASTRNFTIQGDIGAEFELQVFATPASSSVAHKFYNFKTGVFGGCTSENKLAVKMKSNSFSGAITFPANASGDTYSFLLLPAVHKGTTINFGKGVKNKFTTSITQVANSTLTFTPITTATSSYKSMPTSVSSVSSPVSIGAITKEIDWDIENNNTDANGYGLRLIRQPIDTDWYFTPTLTYTIEGAVAPSDVNSGLKVTVDDVTDLCTGMHITAVTGGSSLSGTPTIIAIDRDTKVSEGGGQLTISSAQTFANGHTLTFQARGSSVIQRAIGAVVDFSNWNANFTSAITEQLTKTVRTTATGTTVALDGTRGISGGDFVTVRGLNIVNTGTNLIQTNRTSGTEGGDIASASAGEIILDIAQVVKAGTKLYFDGSTLKITLKNLIKITKHPSPIAPSTSAVIRIIHLNLDNFITPGVQTTG